MTKSTMSNPPPPKPCGCVPGHCCPEHLAQRLAIIAERAELLARHARPGQARP